MLFVTDDSGAILYSVKQLVSLEQTHFGGDGHNNIDLVCVILAYDCRNGLIIKCRIL